MVTRTAADRSHLDLLRQHVYEAFDECIGRAERVAFLMYPMDGNVGNHMMWVALVDYLSDRKIPIAYAANRRNFRVADLRRAVGTGPILFSGGVTFSRLWPAHSDLKRDVAAAFPNNRLVSLMSTMIFVDDADEREAASVFGSHRDTFLMARDPVSAHNARRMFGDSVTVVTAPDSAFALTAREVGVPATHPVIWLARDDVEQSGADVPDVDFTFDWSSDFRTICPPVDRALRFTRRASRLRSEPLARPASRVLNAAIVKGYVRASRAILELGHRKLDTGRVLVTDRMHPHVLAALRGQPVVLLPDRYGKNRAVFDYSTSELSCVHWADHPDQAMQLALDLAGCDNG